MANKLGDACSCHTGIDWHASQKKDSWVLIWIFLHHLYGQWTHTEIRGLVKSGRDAPSMNYRVTKNTQKMDWCSFAQTAILVVSFETFCSLVHWPQPFTETFTFSFLLSFFPPFRMSSAHPVLRRCRFAFPSNWSSIVVYTRLSGRLYQWSIFNSFLRFISSSKYSNT